MQINAGTIIHGTTHTDRIVFAVRRWIADATGPGSDLTRSVTRIVQDWITGVHGDYYNEQDCLEDVCDTIEHDPAFPEDHYLGHHYSDGADFGVWEFVH